MFKKLWFFLALIFSAVSLVVASAIIFLLTTPDPTQITGCFRTKMYEVDLCPQSSSYLRYSQIPPVFVQALLVAEDTDFFHHNGFDFHEIRESVKKNISEGRLARGGSTITQQLAKNAFLDKQKSFVRKLREAYLTWQIESLLTKPQILEKYLNIVEFAPKVYGLAAAAQFYFKARAQDLDLLQSCFLVMLLPSPEKYGASFRQGKLTAFAKTRMETILLRLKTYNRIESSTYEIAKLGIEDFSWQRKEEVEPWPDEETLDPVEAPPEQEEEIERDTEEI